MCLSFFPLERNATVLEGQTEVPEDAPSKSWMRYKDHLYERGGDARKQNLFSRSEIEVKLHVFPTLSNAATNPASLLNAVITRALYFLCTSSIV